LVRMDWGEGIGQVEAKGDGWKCGSGR